MQPSFLALGSPPGLGLDHRRGLALQPEGSQQRAQPGLPNERGGPKERLFEVQHGQHGACWLSSESMSCSREEVKPRRAASERPNARTRCNALPLKRCPCASQLASCLSSDGYPSTRMPFGLQKVKGSHVAIFSGLGDRLTGSGTSSFLSFPFGFLGFDWKATQGRSRRCRRAASSGLPPPPELQFYPTAVQSTPIPSSPRSEATAGFGAGAESNWREKTGAKS